MGMHISKNAARQIVNEISKLVQQNINLMDDTGCIIASCDSERIGAFHHVAHKIIVEGLEEYYVTSDMVTNEIKEGLNLPLELDGEIVGVVGITGPYDKVINSGKLIKKMTEILLMEHRRNYHQLMDKRVRNSFLEEWVIRDEFVNAKEQEEKGRNLGIDIHRVRRAMVVSIAELDNYKDTQEGQSKIAKVENLIDRLLDAKLGDVHFRNASRQILLVNSRSTQGMIALADRISNYVWEKEGVLLNTGIDEGGVNIHQCYIQAHTAWRNAAENNKPYVCYENMRLEILLSSILKENKQEYVYKVFGGMDYEEIREYMTILNVYFKYNGALQRIADVLYIHKNTLQYRLNKLYKITGLDVRNMADAAVLYTAMIIYRNNEY